MKARKAMKVGHTDPTAIGFSKRAFARHFVEMTFSAAKVKVIE